MPRPHSAGILLFRFAPAGPEVLLVHPGGPFWRNKDAGAWMIPKGGIEPGESPAEAALREFREETGAALERVPFPLCTIRQKSGKIVDVFAAEGDFDCTALASNEFELEWPPRSGDRLPFPEVDEARWMALDDARSNILPSQLPVLDALDQRLKAGTCR